MAKRSAWTALYDWPRDRRIHGSGQRRVTADGAKLDGGAGERALLAVDVQARSHDGSVAAVPRAQMRLLLHVVSSPQRAGRRCKAPFARARSSGTSLTGDSDPETAPPRPAASSVRKGEHLRINLEEDVTAKGITSGFERYRFVHQALPDVDLNAVDTSLYLFGRHLSAPLL